MPPTAIRGRRPPAARSQRQLRAGELVRHALVEILRTESFTDPALIDVAVTLSEVRVTPDLKQALCFVEPLGGKEAVAVIAALNRASRFLRLRLGEAIDMKFTPSLKFVHDDSFDTAAHIGRLLDDPRVRRDLAAPSPESAPPESAPPDAARSDRAPSNLGEDEP
jgi:ribosome-binding factor A